MTDAIGGDLTKLAMDMFKDLSGSMKKGMDAATKALGGATGGASKAVEGRSKDLGKGAEGATKALKGLFRK